MVRVQVLVSVDFLPFWFVFCTTMLERKLLVLEHQTLTDAMFEGCDESKQRFSCTTEGQSSCSNDLLSLGSQTRHELDEAFDKYLLTSWLFWLT